MSRIDNCVKHPDVGDGGFIHVPPVTRNARVPGARTHRSTNDGAFVNTNRALCWRIYRACLNLCKKISVNRRRNGTQISMI